MGRYRNIRLKDIYKKYPNYDIIVYGKPLANIKHMIPFSYLPSDRKQLMNMEVIEMQKEEKEQIITGVHFPDMTPIKPYTIKGNIYVYVKKAE